MRFVTLLVALALPGAAMPFGQSPAALGQVYEFYNTQLGHYFYTLDTAEIAAIEQGAAGPGWVKTGEVFGAYQTIESSANQYFPVTCDQQANPCVAVSRFYGTPGLGPNSHFFTGDAAEAEGLKKPGSGWTYEGVAFYLPMPDASGHCAAGLSPIYRSYNNRYMYNDSNHRYAVTQDAYNRMGALGWAQESARFCAYMRGSAEIQAHETLVADESGVVDRRSCDLPTASPRSCVTVDNLPLPRAVFTGSDFSSSDPFNALTQIWQMGNPKVTKDVAIRGGDRTYATGDSFVQLTEWKYVFGMYLSTLSKGASAYTSISTMVRLPELLTTLQDRYNTGYELRLGFSIRVPKLFSYRGSDAYGLSSIEYQDKRSGHRMRANVLAYGTAAPGDFVAKDAKDGVVIVGTSYRQGSPYGRAINGLTSTSVSDLVPYQWYVNLGELAATAAAARTVDPALSADPGDYFVRSFSVQNEISGEGDIALYLMMPRLSLTPLHEF